MSIEKNHSEPKKVRGVGLVVCALDLDRDARVRDCTAARCFDSCISGLVFTLPEGRPNGTLRTQRDLYAM